jgi:hypothetical protein
MLPSQAANLSPVKHTRKTTDPTHRYGTKLLIMALKNDEAIGHQILDRGGVWDGMALGIMLDYLHTGVNVVDAGANIGAHLPQRGAGAAPSRARTCSAALWALGAGA